MPRPAHVSASGLTILLGELRALIAEARQQALRAVDVVQVRTCWEVGRHIVEFEQGGRAKAEYGAGCWRRFRSASRRNSGPVSTRETFVT
ncbi:MAG: hypothetical protein RL077_2430 [Verrucomicrobiota bacterium]